MIETAVNDANCDVMSYSLSSSSASSSADLNSTASHNSSVTESVRSGGSADDTHTDSAVSQCRIGVAVALAFLTGIYQVIALLLINCCHI